jgi:hypothetical protein
MYGTSTFTSDQLHLLDSIAAQCPYVAGDAVYTARVLYSFADNAVFYNDQYTCSDSGHAERMRSNKFYCSASADCKTLLL